MHSDAHTGSIVSVGVSPQEAEYIFSSSVSGSCLLYPCPDAVAAILSALVTTFHCHLVQRISIVTFVLCMFRGFCFTVAKIEFTPD